MSEKDKISTVLNEFKNGKLKDSHGNSVTDHKQALAIALNEAGVSKKSLQKAELVNKLKVQKSLLDKVIREEEKRIKTVNSEIVKFFKKSIHTKGGVDVTSLAKSLDMKKEDLYEYINGVLVNILYRKNRRHG